MDLYHVTKFSPYFSFTVYCFYTKISSLRPVLSTRIVLDCFYLLIFYSEKFSTDVCRLPYAVNVNLNLSIIKSATQRYVDVTEMLSLKILSLLLTKHSHYLSKMYILSSPITFERLIKNFILEAVEFCVCTK